MSDLSKLSAYFSNFESSRKKFDHIVSFDSSSNNSIKAELERIKANVDSYVKTGEASLDEKLRSVQEATNRLNSLLAEVKLTPAKFTQSKHMVQSPKNCFSLLNCFSTVDSNISVSLFEDKRSFDFSVFNLYHKGEYSLCDFHFFDINSLCSFYEKKKIINGNGFYTKKVDGLSNLIDSDPIILSFFNDFPFVSSTTFEGVCTSPFYLSEYLSSDEDSINFYVYMQHSKDNLLIKLSPYLKDNPVFAFSYSKSEKKITLLPDIPTQSSFVVGEGIYEAEPVEDTVEDSSGVEDEVFTDLYGDLLIASGVGSIATVQHYLKNGANIEAKDNDGDTALLLASKYGHKDIVKLLLDNGANLEAEDKDGKTALIWASLNGHKDTVELLLKNGANIESKDKYGRKPLITASFIGHKDTVELLLKNGANIEAKDNDGDTALLNASYNGHKEIVKLLLENGANIEAKDNDGDTALLDASKNGHKDTVELLLEKGANIEAKDNDGNTALIIASDRGYIDTVELLLENGANLEAEDEYNRTALYYAKRKNHNNIVELLKKFSSSTNTPRTTSYTPVHSDIMKAVRGNHLNDVKYYWGKNSYAVDSLGSMGANLLHAAVSGDNKIGIVKYLVEVAGANINIPNKDGNDAIALARIYEHPDIVSYLQSRTN